MNKGFAVANDRLTRQRIPYAAGCIGVAIAAHEMAIEWAKMRSTFGEKLANRQAVQWMLVDNEIDIRTAKHFTLEAAEKAGLPFTPDFNGKSQEGAGLYQFTIKGGIVMIN